MPEFKWVSEDEKIHRRLGGSEKLKTTSAVTAATAPSIQRPASKSQDERSCSICGLVLRDKWTLNDHKKVHENYRPLKCDICGTLFKRGRDLNKHKSVKRCSKKSGLQTTCHASKVDSHKHQRAKKGFDVVLPNSFEQNSRNQNQAAVRSVKNSTLNGQVSDAQNHDLACIGVHIGTLPPNYGSWTSIQELSGQSEQGVPSKEVEEMMRFWSNVSNNYPKEQLNLSYYYSGENDQNTILPQNDTIHYNENSPEITSNGTTNTSKETCNLEFKEDIGQHNLLWSFDPEHMSTDPWYFSEIEQPYGGEIAILYPTFHPQCNYN
ncbi:hypothetical protein BDZ91DRAFT_792282 [Kalaharituber pfeilii]|nr:hypothetical protein BDZ91DRAFT_792282 [Kalaharituber pfeilii]